MKKRAEANVYGVIGLGRFGTALAMVLAEAGKEVIVIDKDESKVKEIRQYTDYAFVADNLNLETLKEIGIQNCDVVIVCNGEQMDMSILTTMRVIELGVPHVISKALSQDQVAVLKKIGAEVVYPEKDMAFRLGKRLVSNNFLEYISLDHSIEIRQLKIEGKIVGHTIKEIDIRKRFGLNIIVVIGKVNRIDEFERVMCS